MTMVFRILLTLCCLVLSINCYADRVIGVVLGVIGEARIQHGNKQIDVQRDTPIFVQDEITSGAEGARVQLRFNDGTLTTLGENTTFRVNKFRYQSKASTTNQAQFKLLKGVFRTVTGWLLEKSGSRYSVITPAGTLGIRGTDFWGGYLSEDNVDVLLISGKHALEVSNKYGSVSLNKAGEGTTLTKDFAAPKLKVWPETKVQKAMATIAWPNGDVHISEKQKY